MIHYHPVINFSSIIYYFSTKMESTNATEKDVKEQTEQTSTQVIETKSSIREEYPGDKGEL